ncbi:MAG: PEP-CTERM sorting domain-containing protein [Planctomycetota bacterium]|nr:PEP-CTERM sorting domain-containing protein [Planctomycetota bacterium]
MKVSHAFKRVCLAMAIASAAASATAQTVYVTGPSTGSTPYVRATSPLVTKVTSILTVDNTGSTPDDSIGGYGMTGIPDGLGAFDNGDGTFTVLMNQELAADKGVVRAHGAKGAFVSKWVINKSDLSVVSGADLIQNVYGWDTTTQANATTAATVAFNRFCSADLAKQTAFYNATTGLGTQEKIFLNGEESGANGWAQATVVTGASAGNSYSLGKFNLSTNGSGRTGVGGWENVVASPYAQDKTVVIGPNDGGTGIMNNALAVYVGTKTNTGSVVDRAGLNNGTLGFVTVAGNVAEIVDATSRATNITDGTRFTLSGTASTVFSRPEDGAWNPLNPSEFWFVTTDRLDQVSDGIGTQIGQTRLWKLAFDDITNPSLGGAIDLVLDGATVNGQKTNMFDNIGFNETTGTLILQEDVGGAAHNGKMWEYDPKTDRLTQLLMHDPSRFGNIGVAATSPYTNDEETSGVIDVTSIFVADPQERLWNRYYLSSDQAHYTTGITTAQVEGGQLLLIQAVPEPGTTTLLCIAGGLLGVQRLRRRKV